MATEHSSSRDDDAFMQKSVVSYDYFRDEIKREDGVTQQRLISALSFHGLLIAAVMVLISGDKPASPANEMFREAALGWTIAIGFFASFVGLGGVLASVMSVHATIKERSLLIAQNEVDSLPHLPEPHGKRSRYWVGFFFPLILMTLFVGFWGALAHAYGEAF
jgi:hypothetical protein